MRTRYNVDPRGDLSRRAVLVPALVRSRRINAREAALEPIPKIFGIAEAESSDRARRDRGSHRHTHRKEHDAKAELKECGPQVNHIHALRHRRMCHHPLFEASAEGKGCTTAKKRS